MPRSISKGVVRMAVHNNGQNEFDLINIDKRMFISVQYIKGVDPTCRILIVPCLLPSEEGEE